MDLKKTKEKHLLSVKLLNKLMEKASEAYVESGNKPIWFDSLDDDDDVQMGIDPSSKQRFNAMEGKGKIHFTLDRYF